MIIDKVVYQKLYPLDPYLNERIGFEATPEPFETPEQVLDQLKDIADKWHEKQDAPVKIIPGRRTLAQEQQSREIMEELIKTITNIHYKEDADDFVKASQYRLMLLTNEGVKNIISLKPSKP